MKYVFLSSFVVLLGASAFTAHFQPEARSKLPILYWATDPNPARTEQIKLFQTWLARNHPDEQFVLKIDSANVDPTKRVLQAVSGNGDDLIDTYDGGEVRFFDAMGAFKDITGDAPRLGFGRDKTYAAIIPEICPPDSRGVRRQVAFPCNVNTELFFVNRHTFREYGLSPPPMRWSLRQFEQIGREFVAAANPNPQRRSAFFCDTFPLNPIRRSLGQGIFNETGTRCILDRPAAVRVLQLDYDWTRKLHLIPTDSEKSSVAISEGFGGTSAQLFNSGKFAMVFIGPFLLIQFRDFDQSRRDRGEPPIDLAVAEPPNAGFPNTDGGGRFAAVYAGGKHPRLAEYFLQFLAGKEYNMQVVAGADALPPNPVYTATAAYLYPLDHPNEWDVHNAYAEAAQNLAIGNSYSPFVLDALVQQEDTDAIDLMMNNLATAQQAAQRAADRINAEIQRSIEEDPSLRRLYDQRVELQAKIDACRASGNPVPISWLDDPFYRKYYQFKGWTR